MGRRAARHTSTQQRQGSRQQRQTTNGSNEARYAAKRRSRAGGKGTKLLYSTAPSGYLIINAALAFGGCSLAAHLQRVPRYLQHVRLRIRMVSGAALQRGRGTAGHSARLIATKAGHNARLTTFLPRHIAYGQNGLDMGKLRGNGEPARTETDSSTQGSKSDPS